ncbi:sideroflexin-3-like [Symsagittifera roscoffensis]|uniref:sideroflexin-3-like n=1 Tax=Symsagittifera roscoffensis TaxID=84072 RepID=UPI00307C5A2A
MAKSCDVSKIDLKKPQWSQETFIGRAKHFFVVTNPLNLLKSSEELETARQIVLKHQKGEKLQGIDSEELWRQKYIYDSAFHPDTGEKMMLIGRMSAQVPMNMTITGLMLTFYKTTPAVVFWQWVNQSFNAVVNYTNRSGDKPIDNKQLGLAYFGATGGALGTALGLNSLVKNLPPLVGRLVPFSAVAAANCINIPMMRSRELYDGIPVFTDSGERIGDSVAAAKKAIPIVTVSRVLMALPGLTLAPVVMDQLDRKTTILKRRPWIGAPIQVTLCGVFLVFATPLCCALFPQQSSLSFNKLEPNLKEQARSAGLNEKSFVYFNKGL